MQKIIDKYNIKAKKSLGQNFLIDEDVLDEIINTTNITEENILEIGPGFGVLTEKILKKNPKSLTLVELDNFMINILNDRLKNGDLNISGVDFSVEKKDVLKFIPTKKNYKIIANIPYYITSPILFRFLYEIEKIPTEMIIMMQKEIGERILQKKSSVLSLFVKKKSIPTKKISVSSKSFLPVPKVDSSVLHFRTTNKYDYISDEEFLKFIKSSFLFPRKKLLNNLKSKGYNVKRIFEILLKNGFSQNSRAEELSLEDYLNLIEIYNKN